jgi:hypothetical protein
VRIRGGVGCAFLLIAIVAPAAYAERGIEARRPLADSLGQVPEPHMLVPVGVGAGVGALGLGAGGIAGAPFGLGGAAVGSLIGMTIGIASGVHLGNNQRGNAEVVGSTALLAGAAALMLVTSGDEHGYWIFVPVAQLVGCVIAERTTSDESPP